MNVKLLSVICTAALSIAACNSDDPGRTANLIPAASARVVGVVKSTSGLPLDSAWVSLVLPGEYGSAFSYTNARGEFGVNANRMMQLPPGPPTPDTLRVELVVQWIKGKRADGTYPELRTQQLLTFAPSSPTPSVVLLQVPVL